MISRQPLWNERDSRRDLVDRHPVRPSGHRVASSSATDAQRSAGACSSAPPFDRYAVMPVARNVWEQVDGGRPAADAHRLIMARTTRRVNGRPVSRSRARSTLPRGGRCPAHHHRPLSLAGCQRDGPVAPVRAAQPPVLGANGSIPRPGRPRAGAAAVAAAPSAPDQQHHDRDRHGTGWRPR